MLNDKSRMKREFHVRSCERLGGATPPCLLDQKVFREKPILKTDTGRGIVLDLRLMTERATYGPLFYPIGDGQQKFTDFGKAFEAYIQSECARRYLAFGCKSLPLNGPMGTSSTSKDSVEIADVVLNHDEGLVFVEAKGVWLQDNLIALPTGEEFWKEVCKKYGMSSDSQAKRKGLAQLAYSIKGMLDGSVIAPSTIELVTNRPVFPILLAHDVNMSIPHMGYFFAKEFCKLFGLGTVPPAGWFDYRGYRIYSIIVMSVDEFENLEHFSDQDLVKFLRSYSDASGLRRLATREFLVGRQKQTPTSDYSQAMKTGRQMVSDLCVRFFDKPLSEVVPPVQATGS